MRKLLLVALFVLLLVLPALANASITYNYTGLKFETYRLDGAPPTVAATGSITGVLTGVDESYVAASYFSSQNLDSSHWNVTLTATLTFATDPERTYTFTSAGMTGWDSNFIQLTSGKITGWNFYFFAVDGDTRTYISTDGSTFQIAEGSSYYNTKTMDTIAGGWYDRKWIATDQWKEASSTVPVPAAVWLLGSGLLGLLGARRKIKK